MGQTESACSGEPRFSPFAIVALLVAILGLPFALSEFGIVFGIVALREIHRGNDRIRGKWLAVCGIVIGALYALLLAYAFFCAIAAAYDAKQRIACCNHLKNLHRYIQMYADEHDGYMPPKNDWEAALLPYAKKGNDDFSCPKERKGVASYNYLGDSGMKITDDFWYQKVPLVCETRARHSIDKLCVVNANGTIEWLNGCELVWCVVNPLRVPQAFCRKSSVDATALSDYARKHPRRIYAKGRGNVMDLRHTTLESARRPPRDAVEKLEEQNTR